MTPEREEQIALIESILDQLRTQGGWFPEPGDREVLKEICVGLRAGTPEASSKALEVVSFVVQAASRSKAQLGFLEVGHHQAIAERVLKHWPVIEHALKQAGESR